MLQVPDNENGTQGSRRASTVDGEMVAKEEKLRALEEEALAEIEVQKTKTAEEEAQDTRPFQAIGT